MHLPLTSAFTAATLLQLSLAAYPTSSQKSAPQYSAAAEPASYHPASHHPAPQYSAAEAADYHSAPHHSALHHSTRPHPTPYYSAAPYTSKHGSCSAGKIKCGHGCHEWYGRCYCPPKPRPRPVAPVSQNGRCGGQSGASCSGSMFGDCCK
jgi:hypothetical protein